MKRLWPALCAGARILVRAAGVASATMLLLVFSNSVAQGQVPPSLAGLWRGEASGPLVKGELTIEQRGQTWHARMAGFDVPIELKQGELQFALPAGQGEFRGRLSKDAKTIVGHWIQPAGTVSLQRRATPVELPTTRKATWVGQVTPLADTMHFYVRIGSGADGKLTAVIRNPERNLWSTRTYEVQVQGEAVTLVNNPIRFRGSYDAKTDRLTLSLLAPSAPLVNLKREADAQAEGFYPRAPQPGGYAYRRPAARQDGWRVASLAEAGLADKPLFALMKVLLAADPAHSNTVPIHSLLIARRGKLVFEEYFHGFGPDQPHDTRSAGKTLAPLLLGVARDHGAKVEPQTPVYNLFPEFKPFANWDERKSKLTVAHLMTMASGLACNDSDNASPGEESRLQAQPGDWHKYTLDLPLVTEPGGQTAIYCSASLNMVGGVAAKVAGQWNADLFYQYIAHPLQFGTYHLNLMPTGEVYTGGGAYLRPRDALKLGQLYLSGGVWNGRRVLSRDWVEWSTQAHTTFAKPVVDIDLNHQYGYGWHVHHFTVGGRTYREYAAEGNGGQFVMVFPELDMVIAVNGGKYGSGLWYRWGLEVIPQYLIPAGIGSRAR
jgi:CubicO group peptidase (beta-lactamase class C family)